MYGTVMLAEMVLFVCSKSHVVTKETIIKPALQNKIYID